MTRTTLYYRAIYLLPLLIMVICCNAYSQSEVDSLKQIYLRHKENIYEKNYEILNKIDNPEKIETLKGCYLNRVDISKYNIDIVPYFIYQIGRNKDKRFLPIYYNILRDREEIHNIPTSATPGLTWVKLTILDILIVYGEPSIGDTLVEILKETPQKSDKWYDKTEMHVIDRMKECIKIIKSEYPSQKREAGYFSKRYINAANKELLIEELSDSVKANRRRYKYTRQVILPVLEDYLDEKYPKETRKKAIRLIDKIAGGPTDGYQAVLPLLGLIADEDEEIRRYVINVLYDTQDPALIPVFKYIADNDKNDEIRKNAKTCMDGMVSNIKMLGGVVMEK